MNNRQFLFDTVVTALRKQGLKSTGLYNNNNKSGAMCMYRGGGKCGTLKCGVGHLIADEFYDPKMENKTATSISVSEAVGKSVGFELSDNDIYMLGKLQAVHDSNNVGAWEYGFKEVACNNAIEYEAPK